MTSDIQSILQIQQKENNQIVCQKGGKKQIRISTSQKKVYLQQISICKDAHHHMWLIDFKLKWQWGMTTHL